MRRWVAYISPILRSFFGRVVNYLFAQGLRICLTEIPSKLPGPKRLLLELSSFLPKSKPNALTLLLALKGVYLPYIGRLASFSRFSCSLRE